MTAPPSVLIVTPSDGGGMLHYASQMANALGERTDVCIVVDEGAGVGLFSEEVVVETVAFPGAKRDLLRGPSYLRALGQLIRRHDPDVVHLTTLTPLLAPVPLLTNGRTLIFTLHDVRQHPSEFKYSYDATARWLAWNADRVVVHGQYNDRQFRQKFGREQKTVVVNHGDYAFFTQYCNDPIEYRPELLFFGRVQEYKGVDTLVRAINRISDFVDDFRVTIAGQGDVAIPDGQAADHLNRVDEYVSNERVCELFSRCRCAVLPYRSATQTGIVPIAYSFQKPVVGSRVGGLPEVVDQGKTGLLVAPESPDELADACIQLLRDREKAQRMGLEADRFRRRHMAWEDIADRLLRTYRSETVGVEGRETTGGE